MSVAKIGRKRQTQDGERAFLTPQGLTVIAYMFQSGSQMLEPAIHSVDFENPCPASALPGLSECKGRLIISNVPFPNIFSRGRKYKLG